VTLLGRLRAEAGLTRCRLAERSGIALARIAAIEAGARQMSGTDAAYLAQALGKRSETLGWRAAPTAPADVPVSSTRSRDSSIASVAAWMADYAEDAMYLERRARRYGIDGG
jgi:transcriptional regulator with XRE-family HTH domain